MKIQKKMGGAGAWVRGGGRVGGGGGGQVDWNREVKLV